jgi:hypothetical protein
LAATISIDLTPYRHANLPTVSPGWTTWMIPSYAATAATSNTLNSSAQTAANSQR